MKNRELNAELERAENDLEEKTELCEDLRHKCEFLTKRNSRLIGQIGKRAAPTQKEVKEEVKEEEPVKQEPDNQAVDQHETELAALKTKIAELTTEKDRLEMRVNQPNESTIVNSRVPNRNSRFLEFLF